MKKIKYSRLCLFFVLYATALNASCNETPQLTIVLVLDQLAYRNLEKVRAYLKGGLRFFAEESIYYTQAHVPYAWPSTGPGHTTINTGTLPNMHGIINNSWANKNYEYIKCDDDSAKNAAVFGPTGLFDYGKSPHFIMTDGISDQLLLQKEQHKRYKVFAIGGKSRSAIGAANKLGKAIWLDPKNGMFTSSKAYYNALPSWLCNFNQRKKMKNQKYTWRLQHGCLPCAYKFRHTNNYKGAKYNTSMIGKTFCLSTANDQYKQFVQTPQANQLVFDAALACLDENFCKDNPNEKIMLWVLPSALDKLGHSYGPDSLEMIDMIYHLDRQIKKFVDCVHRKTRKQNVLWVVTSDHGISPIPEQVQQEGYTQARRILGPEVIKQLNAHLKTTFDLDNIGIYFNGTQLYVNEPMLNSLEKKKRKAIKKEITTFMRKQPGIKQVWTFNKLQKLYLEPGSIESFFKNQLFKGRSASFIVQPYPYVYVSKHEKGIGHRSPYDYDTHVPLMVYRRNHHQRKQIHEKVYITQIAPTLSYILGTPKPSACTTNVLPGIIWQADPCF